jgi:hypothetical protein
VLTRRVARAAVSTADWGSIGGSRHTAPETWAITGAKTPAVTQVVAHELSKHPVTVARCSAERIGPMIMAAPQCGHAHVARVGEIVLEALTVGVGEAGSGAGGAGTVSTVRARATRVVRQVLARNPDWRIRTKPRGKMCWTKRRRNSIAVSVIVRR